MAGELVALNPATLPEIIEALPPRPRDAISLRFYCGLRSDFIWFERLRSPRIPLFSNRHLYPFLSPLSLPSSSLSFFNRQRFSTLRRGLSNKVACFRRIEHFQKLQRARRGKTRGRREGRERCKRSTRESREFSPYF